MAILEILMKKIKLALLFLSFCLLPNNGISKTDENPDIDSDLYPYRYNNWSCPMCGWHWRNRNWNVNRQEVAPISNMRGNGCSNGSCNPQYPSYSKETYLERLKRQRRNLDLEIKNITNQ